jgi:hypothetical protein
MARPKVVVFVALLAFALTGCPGQTGAFDEWRMRNDTDEIIYVFWLDDGEEVRIGPIPPNRQLPLPVRYPDQCSSGILIARTSSGREVARRTEPLCMDNTWIITGLST